MRATTRSNGNGAGGNASVADEEFDERDKAALELTLKCYRAQSAAHAQDIDEMLAERSRVDVALYAAYSCQMARLRLKPWETPPCHISDIDDDRAAVKLLRKMLHHGVSRYHPSPLAAIERAQGADRGPRAKPWAVELYKMAGRGHDFRAEIHEELGLGPQHPSVLDIDVLGDPPDGLSGVELENWKLVQRLLGQLIV